MVVAADVLQLVSFAGLMDPNRSARTETRWPLVADHEIITIPSASLVAVLRGEEAKREPASKTLAVVADAVYDKDDPRVGTGPSIKSSQHSVRPTQESKTNTSYVRDCTTGFQRLPFSRREGIAILGLTTPNEELRAFDFDANRKTATSAALSQYRYVHFASHACINSEHPELSALVLSLVNHQGNSQDGFIRLHEVYTMHLTADLVVLSACETGLGANVSGEGLVGLTRGFMYAGARQVVVSLWRVDDEATSELMKIFYQQMLLHHLRPAAALRAAQIAIWKQPRWRAPYYWGAFVIQGDWR